MNRLVAWAVLGLFAMGVVASADSPPSSTQTTAAHIQRRRGRHGAQILRQSCEFLAQTKSFTVHAEIWKDEVLPSEHKIQVTRSIDLDVARPDRFHLDAKAHHKGRSIWFDGKKVTVLDRERNVYGIAPAAGETDQALDLLSEKFGITVPLEDLAVSDPYANAMKNVTDGGYFGDEPILGVPCRHIGFSNGQDRLATMGRRWTATAAAETGDQLTRPKTQIAAIHSDLHEMDAERSGERPGISIHSAAGKRRRCR